MNDYEKVTEALRVHLGGNMLLTPEDMLEELRLLSYNYVQDYLSLGEDSHTNNEVVGTQLQILNCIIETLDGVCRAEAKD